MNPAASLPLSLGVDVGSTTAKIAVLRGDDIVYTAYGRHYSRIREALVEMLREAAPVLGKERFTAAISGSAGLGLAEGAGIPFVQEVWATGEVIKKREKNISVVIELGGEDAKIIFWQGGTDERMNGTCAGGTGAFIDQMASLLDVTPDELDELSLRHGKTLALIDIGEDPGFPALRVRVRRSPALGYGLRRLPARAEQQEQEGKQDP